MDLIFKDEFYKIKKTCIEVRKRLGNGFLEKVYEKALLIELKCAERLNEFHKAQLLNYLKATKIELGILINFPNNRIGFEIVRIPNLIGK